MAQQFSAAPVRIGIDATNLRGGGGVTHLIELLSALDPRPLGIVSVDIWGGNETLSKLPTRPWLVKHSPQAVNGPLWRRTWWQSHHLTHAVKHAQCDVLFIPGGSYWGTFHPYVAMSQNLLPFETSELRRYGVSLTALKMLALRWIQTGSLRHADGVIFLNTYSQSVVLAAIGVIHGLQRIIPHGINPRFQHPDSLPAAPLSDSKPLPAYRVLYVATIDLYKHQWHVVQAIALLRQKGLEVSLDLVGSAHPSALKKLNSVIARLDPSGSWVHYHGAMPYERLDAVYRNANAAVFASTCESFGLPLLEAMAAGLPIACTNKSPMSDIVGKAAVFFNPEDPQDIADAMFRLLSSPALQTQIRQEGFNRIKNFNWQLCAKDTFEFLVTVARSHHEASHVKK